MRIKGDTSWLYLLPALTLLGVFLVYPIVYSFYLSLQAWDGISANMSFIAFSNYETLFRDPYFYNALKNSIIWTLIYVSVPLILGIFLAVLVDARIKGETVFKSIICIPLSFSFVATGVIWAVVFDPDFGVLNSFLRGIGLGSFQQAWLSDPSTALFGVIVGAIWAGTGFALIIFLVGLRAIPPDIVEAARIDGANAWQQFRKITLPLLHGPVIIVLAINMISSLKVFDIVYVMTRSGPFESSDVLATFMYRESFEHYRMGYGSAISVVIFLIAAIVSLPYIRKMIRGE